MHITTLPVWSKLAQEKDVPPEVAARLPESWRLSSHQVETYQALTTGDADVIFNTAMTGDGKSLAAYLPVLIEPQYHTFGMYPTNELSRDQERQFENYIRAFKRSFPYCALSGAAITQFAEQYEFNRRGDALKERFDNHNVILTNPDIFSLVMNYRYGSGIFSEQELPYSLCTNFDSFVLDEFHIFAMPQIIAALTAALYIHENGGRHKFLFSSATPNEILFEMVRRSGLRYQTIEGVYSNEGSSDCRPVLHPAALSIHRLGEKQSAEDWLYEHVEELDAFWESQSPRPKSAVIVNSVAAARRIARMLDEVLSSRGISVGENTGLTDAERRKVSLQKDIVVGTSTIDVGVDFNINLLIFESTNAGTFLQRLGRLGRYRMGEAAFERYEAHALISGKTPWVYERLVQALAEHGVADGGAVNRAEHLTPAVQSAFPVESDFFKYAKRWGVLQAVHIVNVLGLNKSQRAYDGLAADLTQRYEHLLQLADLGSARKRYWYLSDKQHAQERMPILDEVIAFRGSSPFQVGCWDATIEPESFLAYDLFSLVQSAVYEVVTQDEYERAVAKRFADAVQRNDARAALKYTMRGKGDRPLVLKIVQFNAEREWLKLKVSEDLSLWSDQVFVLRGLAIAEPTSVQLPAVNEVLKRQAVVCYATRRDPRELRRILRLPAHFPLYTAVDIHRNRDYTLAFGKAALMLEAQLLGWKNKDVENEPIIC
ncbi:MAG: type I-D CRISPR-associated helicase Cas3' [Chloroflexota bacterium]